ncbi:MAG: tyrosine-type recombinase/integrase, partial [Ruminococcus sp.]|nr:tyrosine-type recombinase/integrase [Ruminococcus sp.]
MYSNFFILFDFYFSVKSLTLEPDSFLLTGTSHFIEPRILQNRIKKYSRECGIKDIHFHVLRHTFVTRCVEVGFEIKSLSEVLGHSSPRI